MLKTMLLFADEDAIQKYIDIYLHHERIIANTQLQPTHTLDLTTLNLFRDVKDIFRVQGALDIEEIKSYDLDLSIELLLVNILAYDTHEEKLLATYLKFLKRFYKEYFTDAREGAFNLLNTTQQTNLGILLMMQIKSIMYLKYYTFATFCDIESICSQNLLQIMKTQCNEYR